MSTPKFRTGTDLVKQHAAGSGKRKFTPNIYWKPGDVRVIAWLGTGDDIVKVRLHQMIRIPDDSRDAGFRYETLICKKDPSMIDESGGLCDLCDRVGHEASEKFVLRAIELTTVKEGKKVKELAIKEDSYKDKDGNDQTAPRWGLVIQASKNFFSYFASYQENNGDIDEVAWEIHREGGGTDTKYHPFVVMNGPNAVPLPDLSEVADNIPDLFDLLADMATTEKYDVAETLAPNSQPSFGGKKKSSDDGIVPSGERATEFEKMRDSVSAY